MQVNRLGNGTRRVWSKPDAGPGLKNTIAKKIKQRRERERREAM